MILGKLFLRLTAFSHSKRLLPRQIEKFQARRLCTSQIRFSRARRVCTRQIAFYAPDRKYTPPQPLNSPISGLVRLRLIITDNPDNQLAAVALTSDSCFYSPFGLGGKFINRRFDYFLWLLTPPNGLL
jgi:hypothetical protein